MEAKFIKEYTLRTSDFDCNKRIHISSVLDLFQDVAGTHAVELGCSGEEMLKKGLLWVLVSVRLQILKQPKVNDTVKVLTWPLEQKGVRFQRDYKVFNEQGELIILGTSKWVFIDVDKRKVVKAFDVYPKGLDYYDDKSFDFDQKIPPFDTADDEITVLPQFTHLDSNGHVNNIKYADFLVDAMNNTNLFINGAQIDYKSEVMYHTPLNITYKKDRSEVLFKGTDGNGQTKFTAKITLG